MPYEPQGLSDLTVEPARWLDCIPLHRVNT